MSHDANKWEADICRAVESHEFDYDPAAWAAMEQMLDGAGGPAGTFPGGATGLARGWEVLILLLLGLGGLLWLFWPAEQAAPPPPSQIETPARPDTPQRTVEPIAPEKSGLVPDNPGSSNEAAPGRETLAPLLPLPDTEVPLLPLPVREEQLRPRWAVPPILPARPPALLERPDSLPAELKQFLPEPGKRRRDRKTLFPDVIEKY